MTTTSLPQSTSRSAARSVAPKLFRAGAIAGVVAAVATTVGATAAKAMGVPMMAAPQTAAAGEPLPVELFAVSTLANTVVGVLLALAAVRWVRRPAVTFVVVTVVLTLISFAGPVTTGHATTATRLVLALTHVVAAAIVIPALARRLPATR
jgi:hypothetical protein